MKITSADALAVLRAFGVANDEAVPRHIERLSVSQPSLTNTLVQFRYNMQQYGILLDSDAADDSEYIDQELSRALPGVDHQLLANPRDSRHTYGYPYKGKDLYLLRLGAVTERLDVYLARTYTDISRSSWQKYIKQGAVSIDGKVATSAKHPVDASSVIEVNLPEAPDHSGSELPILHIDDNVIVINKPAGVLTHHKNQLDTEFTVADMVARYAREDIEGERPGIVHRLDRDTSGVIIGARTQAAYDMLKAQFAERDVHKEYIAIINGHLQSEQLNIDIPIARNSAKPGTFKADPDGKDAQTMVTAIDSTDHHSLVSLKPRTGRTHQLRVHMAHLGTPIHGDKLYGAKPAERLYLHAHKLTVDLPSGEQQTFTAPIPKTFDLTRIKAGK